MKNRFVNLLDKNDSQLIIFTLLIILSLLVIYPLSKTGFTTTDDATTILTSNTFTEMYNMSFSMSKEQGRIGHVVGLFLARLPYYFQNEFAFQTLKLGSLLLAVILFCGIIGYFLDKSVAILSFTLFMGFLQNDWHHSLVTSYPFFFNFSLICYFASIWLFIKYKNTGYVMIGVSSGIFYFITLMIYEIYVLYFVIYLGIYFYETDRKSLSAKRYSLYPLIIALLSYLYVYFIFRNYYPSTYNGNQTFPEIEVLNALKVIWQYSISALPGYFSLNNTPVYGIMNYNFSTILSEIKIEWLIKSLVVFSLIFIYIKKINYDLKLKYLLLLLIISGILIFLPNVLLSLTAKYQIWVILGKDTAYVTTYFSYFAVILFISIMITIILKIKNNYFKTFFSIGVSLFSAYISLITDFHNHYITLDQQLSHLKWKVIDQVILSEYFQKIPDKSIIYAPSLWKMRGIVGLSPTYWNDYIKYKTGKQVNIIGELPSNQHFYFMKFAQETFHQDNYFLFAKIEDPKYLAAKEVSIYTFSNNVSMEIQAKTLHIAPILINGKLWEKSVEQQYYIEIPLLPKFFTTNIFSEGLIEADKIRINYFQNLQR